MRDLYADLGVPHNATADQIHEAYRRIQYTCHPDRNPGDRAAEERFLFATLAREVLLNSAKRAEYDRMRVSNARGTLDPAEFINLLSETMQNLGPEFAGMRAAALARNWLGLAFSTGKVGFGLFAMARAARDLVFGGGAVGQSKSPAHARPKAIAKKGKK